MSISHSQSLPLLHYLKSLELYHDGDCRLLGVLADSTLFVEEIYDVEPWIAQHKIAADGDFVETVDEDHGRNEGVALSDLPESLITPRDARQSTPLNFSGPRFRGLRGPERAGEMMLPLPVPEKMALVERLGLEIMPPLLLGLAESVVLSEALLQAPDQVVVCRRVRLAYALAEPQTDTDGLPYDYDSLTLYVAHGYDANDADTPSLLHALDGLPGADLHRPMDCLIAGGHLYIADGGGEARRNRVHVWSIEAPSAPAG